MDSDLFSFWILGKNLFSEILFIGDENEKKKKGKIVIINDKIGYIVLMIVCPTRFG